MKQRKNIYISSERRRKPSSRALLQRGISLSIPLLELDPVLGHTYQEYAEVFTLGCADHCVLDIAYLAQGENTDDFDHL